MDNLLEWFGYFASTIIVLSMAMNSIVKFRWINFFGAGSFATYGALIGAWPVVFLNGLIVLIDIYYLRKIYFKKELFDIIEVENNNEYKAKFLDFHRKDIETFFPGFDFSSDQHSLCFFILRNTAVAGIFLGERINDHELHVKLDYVIPEYRDYKNGSFIYHRLRDRFLNAGYRMIKIKTQKHSHSKYLKKMGFQMKDEENFEINMHRV